MKELLIVNGSTNDALQINTLVERKMDFFLVADTAVPGLILGQIIGRWGNFFNSEAFGLPTQLPWKLYIPYALRPLEYKNYEFFHPAFLYKNHPRV